MMQEIIACDAHGNSLNYLVQWDQDVHVYLQADGIDSAYRVHFFNNSMDESYVVDSTFQDGILKAKIPNALLTMPYIITGYVDVTKDKENKCLYGFKINVKKKPKPSNYVYLDTNDYVSIEDIRDECRDIADEASGYADKAKASAKESSDFATNAKSWAVGGTLTRENEEQDNAKYYYNETRKSEALAEQHKNKADGYASSALASAESARQSEALAGQYASQVSSDKKEIDETIKNSLLDNAGDILAQVTDYFKRAEALYRSCTIVCDGEIPARRVRTIIEIDCHYPERRVTGYYGVDFDGQTPAMRLLGE